MATVTLAIPELLAAACERDGRTEWLAVLPRKVEAVARRWSLDLGDPFRPGGHTAWVAPVRMCSGADAVLKVAWRHFEAEHEAHALRTWDGDGAVRVHAADDVDETTCALLLERCVPGAPLATWAEDEQDVVVAGLLRRLWRVPPPDHPFRPLASMCDAWADEFEALRAAGRAPIDPALARDGTTLFRSLPTTADASVVLCTDLHAGNILAARREPWLVIDPKPYVGDPTYDALQHMLNCRRRLERDPNGLVNRIAGLAGLDEDRLRLWLFARCVQESPESPDLAEIARRIAPA